MDGLQESKQPVFLLLLFSPFSKAEMNVRNEVDGFVHGIKYKKRDKIRRRPTRARKPGMLILIISANNKLLASWRDELYLFLLIVRM